MNLADWLLEAIAAEEALARDAASEGSPYRTGWQLWTNKVDTTPGGEVLGPRGTVEAHPARVLAECTAKRDVVELHKEVRIERLDDEFPGDSYDALCVVDNDDFPCQTLRLLAQPYRDREGYRPEWNVQ